MQATWSIVKRWKELSKSTKHITAEQIQLLYKRDGLLAISKPFGLPVHSGPGQGKSVLDLMEDFRNIHNLKETPRLLHRLDKNTSGLLLLAYNGDMAAKVSELFRDKKIFKTYLGVTVGVPASPNGVIVDRLCEGVVGNDRKLHRMVTVNDTQNEDEVMLMPNSAVMKAHTAYSILDTNELSCALVKYMTKSGIKHQIRLHSASSLNCPILGDHKFSSFNNEPQKLPLRLLQLLGIRGVQSAPDAKGRIQPWQRGLIPLHLFAEAVEIPELRTDGRPVTIKAQMPTFFRETLESCRLRYKEGGKSYSSNRLSRVLSK